MAWVFAIWMCQIGLAAEPGFLTLTEPLQRPGALHTQPLRVGMEFGQTILNSEEANFIPFLELNLQSTQNHWYLRTGWGRQSPVANWNGGHLQLFRAEAGLQTDLFTVNSAQSLHLQAGASFQNLVFSGQRLGLYESTSGAQVNTSLIHKVKLSPSWDATVRGTLPLLSQGVINLGPSVAMGLIGEWN